MLAALPTVRSRRLELTFAAFALLLTAACSSDNRAPAPTLTSDVRITADNAVDVAAAVYHATLDPLRLARVAGSLLTVPPPDASASLTNGVAALLGAQTVEGPEGGSAIISWDDRDADGTYSTGDVFAMACDEYADLGVTLTGAFRFDAVVIDGDVIDGLVWIAAAELTCSGLQATIGSAEPITIDGTFAFRREKRQTVYLLSLEPSADVQLGPRAIAGGNAMARNDYVLDFRMGLLLEGSVDDALIGGAVTFTTDQVLTGLQALPDPSGGRLDVFGADGSKLTLVPLDFFTLELQLDADGDGEVDETIEAEWAQF